MIQLRKKIFEKLAQQTPTAGATATAPITGNPQAFSPESLYPSIIIGFTPFNLAPINHISNILNNAIFYSSAGKKHLKLLRDSNFNVDSSSATNSILKNLIEFSKQIYNLIYTDAGANYKKNLTPDEIKAKVAVLKNSPFLLNIPSSIPSKELTVKFPEGVKTSIINQLAQIK